MSRKIPKKKEPEKPEKQPKIEDQKGKNPRRGSLDFSQKPTFLGPFRLSRWLAPVAFQKSDFLSMKSFDLYQHHGSAAEIMGSSSDASKSPTDRPWKHTFYLIDREINWTDVTGPLVSINVWSCMVIRHQEHVDPSAIIARRIPKDVVRPATLWAPWQPLNAVKWIGLWKVNAVINSLFWRAQSEARKKELQVQAIMALNHVTPLIMEFKGD